MFDAATRMVGARLNSANAAACTTPSSQPGILEVSRVFFPSLHISLQEYSAAPQTPEKSRFDYILSQFRIK
jgi:hypothetical protein